MEELDIAADQILDNIEQMRVIEQALESYVALTGLGYVHHVVTLFCRVEVDEIAEVTAGARFRGQTIVRTAQLAELFLLSRLSTLT